MDLPSNSAPRSEDDLLIEAAVQGDQKAFRGLYERHQGRVYRLIRSMVGSADDAMDILQQVFIQAFRSLKGFKGKSSFYTWLYRIALNRVTDFRRKQARNDEYEAREPYSGIVRLSPAPESEGPERELYNRELAALVRKGIDSLSREHREIIILREIEGLSYAEIAEVTGLGAGTVMSRLHYARKRLGEILLQWEQFQQEV